MNVTMMARSAAGAPRQKRVFVGLDEPFGYPDGLNAYTVEMNRPVSDLDPNGLKIIILIDSEKAGEESVKEGVTWQGYFNDMATAWNKRLEELLNLLPKTSGKEYQLNGCKSDLQALTSALKAAEMEIRILDKDPKKAAQQIQQAARDAGPGGEVSIETHTQIDVAGEYPIKIGDQFFPVGDIGGMLGHLPSRVTFGTCELDQKSVDALAKDLGTDVGGTGGLKHKPIGGIPGRKRTPGESDNVINIVIPGPFDGAPIHGSPGVSHGPGTRPAK